ncbi:MAG: hypothetical protein DME33_03365 [Verrucomicrobia bacterium]|nr:MAG: hypothetical protein DME33_03365 [Verrucomicrobiota bacterium]
MDTKAKQGEPRMSGQIRRCACESRVVPAGPAERNQPNLRRDIAQERSDSFIFLPKLFYFLNSAVDADCD